MITIFAPLFEWVLGADHPDTKAARMAEAIPLYRGALADCERVRGTDHPSTLRSRNNLAMAYRAAGRTAEAIPLLERALAGCERVRGTDHPDTLTTRNNLAMAYRAAGRTAEAIPLLERALAGCERVRGTDHPDTNAARKALSALTGEPKRHGRVKRHSRVWAQSWCCSTSGHSGGTGRIRRKTHDEYQRKACDKRPGSNAAVANDL